MRDTTLAQRLPLPVGERRGEGIRQRGNIECRMFSSKFARSSPCHPSYPSLIPAHWLDICRKSNKNVAPRLNFNRSANTDRPPQVRIFKPADARTPNNSLHVPRTLASDTGVRNIRTLYGEWLNFAEAKSPFPQEFRKSLTSQPPRSRQTPRGFGNY